MAYGKLKLRQVELNLNLAFSNAIQPLGNGQHTGKISSNLSFQVCVTASKLKASQKLFLFVFLFRRSDRVWTETGSSPQGAEPKTTSLHFRSFTQPTFSTQTQEQEEHLQWNALGTCSSHRGRRGLGCTPSGPHWTAALCGTQERAVSFNQILPKKSIVTGSRLLHGFRM